ncbi:hypothetical protein EFA46_013350 (plasmid) [Halarchaeum sp. CBA1220]|uniref:hypothetical protein n=1 Tax=Halarchaeum sp. CBA1220 TaxID=1853682 RepID=UPI000F3A9644|nr:hypothetical protein [Halarchaeum sp. CBA1220]QLC35250.1 hypothetical protein EFA46_013350 [Halarchaeum sp. CBA1220]
MSDDDPDAVFRSTPLSRREALTAGLGAVAATAGCSMLPTGSQTGGENTPSSSTVAEDHQLDPRTVDMGADPSFDIDGSEIEVNLRGFAASRFDEAFEGTIRVYSVPHRETLKNSQPREFLASRRQLLDEREITQEQMRDTYAFDLEFPEGYAQRFVISAEVAAPAQLDEHVIHRSDQIYLPFTNEARGETVLREISGNRPTEDGWDDGMESINKVELWFDEPDDSPFDVPSIDESAYDPDWYRYRDLTVTAVVRFATYDDVIGRQDLPVFEWMAFSLNLSEWELLEAFRWNSIATQELEYGTRTIKVGQNETEPIDDYSRLGSLMSNAGQKIFNSQYIHATDSPTPYEMYRKRRYLSGERNNQMSPLYFAGGRPFCKRAAQTIAETLDNPSFESLSNPEYYKATALKTFIGDGVPYSFNFSAGDYVFSPEELVNNWFRHATQDASLGADCRHSSVLFCGIGVHLLDNPVGYVTIPSAGHAMACVVDLDLDLNGSQPLSHPIGWVDNYGAYRSHHGELTFVECTRGASTIGYRPTLNLSEWELRSYFSDCEMLSHIPLNDALEPAADGTIRAPAENPENPFTYAETHETLKDFEAAS